MKTFTTRRFTQAGKKVAEYINSEDKVLECACGTGAISIYIAEKCKNLIATDFAEGMLKQASKKCRHFKNVTFQKADITKLEFAGASFDKNVSHFELFLVHQCVLLDYHLFSYQENQQ